MSKVAPAAIVIEWCEGSNHGPTSRCPVVFHDWQGADGFLMQIRADRLRYADDPEDRSYHKTGFVVLFANGDTHRGRVDVTQDHPCDLERHVREWYEVHSGQKCPVHLTRAQFDDYLRGAKVDTEAHARALERLFGAIEAAQEVT